MISSSLEKKLIQQISAVLPPASPGLQVQVHQAGRKLIDLSIGDTYPYYDLASLTKVIFTVQAMMKAFDEGKWDFKTRVQQVLHWFPNEETLLKDLLNHSSGLPWWFPFYQKVDLNSSSISRWTESARLIREMPLEKKPQSVYSDVGFILLGHCLEAFYDRPLIDIWKNLKQEFYSQATLDFHPENKPLQKPQFYAPTERCAWRGKLIQGEVHDDNAWAFGGVSTHAGLFGSIDDLGWFALFVRTELQGISRVSIRQKTAQTFSKRARPLGAGDWTLGYMMPTRGSSSSGHYFSSESIGHTGFTGTSFWYDPVQDLSVVMVSNRVFLGRENKEFASLRPQIHNWIIEGLKRG